MYNVSGAIENIENRYVYKLMRTSFMDNFPSIGESNDFLEICELYKIITISGLVTLLNEGVKDQKVVIMTSEYKDSKFNLIYDKLHNNGFYIYHYDEANRVVTVATSIDNIDYPNIDLYFGDLKVERVALTPLNYLKFNNPSKVEKLTLYTVYFLRIIAEGAIKGASDVRFSSFQLEDNMKEYPLRFRIGNELKPYSLFQLDEKLVRDLLSSITKDKSIFEESQIVSPYGALFSIYNCFGIDNYQLRIKINNTEAGYMANVRIMKVREISGANSLGFNPRVNEVINAMTRVENGLCLVTGPQRTGKSTTLMAVFKEVCKKPISVAELSNPVESPLPLDPLSYSKSDDLLALCSACKKLDLDVVLLNEVPDKAVADSVYDLVNSSVGVFTTFHINRIWHLCYKLDEYFSGRLINVISYLRYVLNQKAFEKQCPHCRQERVLDYNKSDLYPEVLSICKKLGITSYSEAVGCTKCGGTGLQVGIQPFVEYIVFDDEFKSELAKCNSLYEMEMKIREKVTVEGTSLESFVLDAVKCGDIHPNELINLL